MSLAALALTSIAIFIALLTVAVSHRARGSAPPSDATGPREDAPQLRLLRSVDLDALRQHISSFQEIDFLETSREL